MKRVFEVSYLRKCNRPRFVVVRNAAEDVDWPAVIANVENSTYPHFRRRLKEPIVKEVKEVSDDLIRVY